MANLFNSYQLAKTSHPNTDDDRLNTLVNLLILRKEIFQPVNTWKGILSVFSCNKYHMWWAEQKIGRKKNTFNFLFTFYYYCFNNFPTVQEIFYLNYISHKFTNQSYHNSILHSIYMFISISNHKFPPSSCPTQNLAHYWVSQMV